MKKKNLPSKKDVLQIEEIQYNDNIFDILTNECMKYKIDESSK